MKCGPFRHDGFSNTSLNIFGSLHGKKKNQTQTSFYVILDKLLSCSRSRKVNLKIDDSFGKENLNLKNLNQMHKPRAKFM